MKIGDSLTAENLLAIKDAMDKIKEVDRSLFFNQYLNEVEARIKDTSINITARNIEDGTKYYSKKNSLYDNTNNED
jgi:hypothetical protein